MTAYASAIETAAMGEFLLDVRGLGRLHGDEMMLAEQLRRVAHEATGLTVNVGLATGKIVAAVAARQASTGGALVVAPGREAELVAPLPLEDLPLASIEVLRRLKLFDFKIPGDLAALRKPAVLRQFGPDFAELYELARGNDRRFLSPVSSNPNYTVTNTADEASVGQRRLEREKGYALFCMRAAMVRCAWSFRTCKMVNGVSTTPIQYWSCAHPRHSASSTAFPKLES